MIFRLIDRFMPAWGGVLAALVLWGATLSAEEKPASPPPQQMATQPDESAKVIWVKRCRMCHANPGMLKSLGVKDPQTLRPWRVAAKDPDLFKTTVKAGRKRMPSFYLITDSQLEDLRTYLVQSSTPGSPLPPN